MFVFIVINNARGCAQALDISAEVVNELVWALASDALKKMPSCKTPGEKVACVVKCASILFRSLNLARAKAEESGGGGEAAAYGADDFLPIFIYVVLKSNVPNLHSNCEYIQSFLDPAQMRSQSGYFFVNLR